MDEKRIIVRDIQEYIKDHIHEEITLAMISRHVYLSPSYVTKIFKEITGYTPYYYIKARRLSEAAMLLRDHDIKVIDVALEYVFDSHEGFTRAFTKQFGIAPKSYAKNKPPIKWFLPYPITVSKKEAIMDQFIFTQVIERPKRKALILRGREATEYFQYCEEVGCDVWGILMSVKEALFEPAGFWLPKSLVPIGTSTYVQGVEVPLDYKNAVPEGFELIELAACKIMIFQGQAYDDENFEAEITSMMAAMDNFNPNLYGYEYNYEDGIRFQLEPRGERGYIEGRPIKEIK